MSVKERGMQCAHLDRVEEVKLTGKRSHCVCPLSTHVECLYAPGIPRILIIHAFITAAFLIIFGIFLQCAQSLLSLKQSLPGPLSLSAA